LVVEAVTLSSLIASSVLSFLAIVFSISLVALQLANQQYSPWVISIFERAGTTKVVLSLFIATFVYSFMLLVEVLRSSLERITIISLYTEDIYPKNTQKLPNQFSELGTTTPQNVDYSLFRLHGLNTHGIQSWA
jgi:hypothetical protein